LTEIRQQRIRDPLHNLIVFSSSQFEHTLWRMMQTRPFQRLRRIRQLGFSEFVFPGATHTRFAHSIGTFHLARRLMQVIEGHTGEQGMQFRTHQARVALAAALVHDVGHGMFSHAFEQVGKDLNLPLACHENVGARLIEEGEISEAFEELGSGFARDVAKVIKGSTPRSLYDTVVSSQFDADRLDYMQRDRMMTGIESSGIDATWLLANLEIALVQFDDRQRAETLVVGPKAFRAAENYVLSLFQLYPNVYFHKATRAAEKVFSYLIRQLIDLVHNGHKNKTGLPSNHPINRFAEDSDDLENVLGLDDAVFWGALPMMIGAEDQVIRECARRLWLRDLPKCLDVRQQLEDELPLVRDAEPRARAERQRKVCHHCDTVISDFKEWAQTRPHIAPSDFIDKTSRLPYKQFKNSDLNQILIRSGNGHVDMAQISPVVASAETFDICRVYVVDAAAEAELSELLKKQKRKIAANNKRLQSVRPRPRRRKQ
jgi:HD superfamily phosphohydrolase